MAQWTGTGSWVSSYVGTLTAVESSYSVENNSSEVTVSLLLENNAYNRFVNFKVTGSISSDGTVVQSASFTGSMQPTSYQQYHSLDVISSYTFTVPHNADGTKTISLSATITTATGYGSDNAKIGAGTINITGGTLALTNIPRASTISAPNIQIGSSGTLTITKAVSSHVNTVTWSCATLSGTIATKSSSTSISFTPPTTLYAKLPNSTSANITYTVTTYTSSSATTSIGSNTATATVTVGSSIKPSAPSITLLPVNTNTWLNTKGYYVSGYTKLNIAATATAGSGATLSPLSASVAGQTGTFNSGSNYTTANAISAAGAVTATVTASDSRGRSTSNTASVTYVSYTAPSVTTLTAERGTYSGGTWTTSPSGAHIRVTYTVALSLSENSIKTGSIACTGQTSQSISATSGTVYFTGTTTTSAYTITISVTDQVGTTVTKTASVSTISVPFNFNNNLPAMGFGKLASKANAIESAWPFYTSFRDGVAPGSYGSSQTTVGGLVGEVRFSSGAMGSANINTAYTLNGITIPTGWYNFVYSPHRDGGRSGAAQGDNCNYGNLFLLGMNNRNGMYRLRIDSGAINQVIKYGENSWNIYSSVSELGQTEGSATISAVWAAMPDCSMLICQASQFTSNDRPSSGGSSAIIVIVRRASGRGWLYAYGKGESHCDARMFLNASNVPTGTWDELADFIVDTYDERVTTNVPITWTIRKYHSGICEAFGIGDSTGYPMTQQYTNGYYFASRFDLPSGLFTSVTYATVERSGGSNSGGLITASTYGFDTTKVQFYAFDTRSETINCSFMCHVFGKWK